MKLPTRLRHLMALALIFAGAVFGSLLHSPEASAGFNQLPTKLPEWDNMWLVVSQGKEVSGVGANQVTAPATWIKVYSKQRTLKNLKINYGNGVTGATEQRCGGTKRLTAYRANWRNEARLNTSANLGTQSSGCGEKTITIPASAFSTKTSDVTGHKGLYISILKIEMLGNPAVNGPRSAFRIYPNDASNVRLGFWGLYNSGEGSLLSDNMPFSALKANGARAVALYVQGEADTHRYKFAPPCDYDGPMRNRFLNWSDDDRWGQQNPWGSTGKQAYLNISGTDYNMPRWIRNSPGWSQQNNYNQDTGVITGGATPIHSFGWAGEGGQGRASLTLQHNKKYTVRFERMAGAGGVNTLVVWFPFDSGDFDFDCPPDPGWKLEPKTTEINRRSGVAFNYTEPTGTQAQQEAIRKANRKSAAQALRKVEFKHTLTNKRLAGTKHVKTSRARGPAGAGCYEGVSLNGSYCARIQQKVIRADGYEGDWKWRFGYQNNVSGKQQVDDNGFSQFINPGQTVRVNRGFDNKPFSPLHPPAYNTGNNHGQNGNESNLDYRLDRVKPGDRYCERLVVKWDTSKSQQAAYSPRKCVTLGTDSQEPYWNLKPTVDTRSVVQQGDRLTPGNTQVLLPVRDTDYENDEDIDEPDATGENYTRAPATWSISRFTLPPDKSLETLDNGLRDITTTNQNPCQWIDDQTPGIPSGCATEAEGTGTFDPASEPTNPILKALTPGSGFTFTQGTGVISFDTQNTPIGGSVCFTVSVSRPQAGHTGDEQPNMTWRHSKAACTTVMKNPKVWFRNGDLRAGRGFQGHDLDGNQTSQPAVCPVPTTGRNASIYTSGVPRAKRDDPLKNLYGSWVEYGAFATGNINGFGSAATPAGITDSAATLTFSNTSPPTGTLGGQFSFGTSCLPNYFNWVGSQHEVPSARLAGGITLGSEIENGKPSFAQANNVNVSGTNVTGSRILHVRKGQGQKGNITITGNITMEQTARPLAQMPQIVLIADGDITINSNVTRVDAWLIAKGKINTCQRAPAKASDCNQQLVVTGPVAASKLNLYRTYGADLTDQATSWKPAEEFLWSAPLRLVRLV